MQINDTLLDDVKQWRQHIHSQPELGFKEFKTAAFIVDKLQSFGIDVHQGLGGTGIVGTLKNGEGPTIGRPAGHVQRPLPSEQIQDPASLAAIRVHQPQ